MDMRIVALYRLFAQALAGKRIWRSIRKKYHIKEDGYLLIYAGEDALLEQAMEYLPEFLEKKYASLGVVVILKDMQIQAPASGRRIRLAKVKEWELDALLRYYRMNSFFCHVIPLSLREPYGSYGLLRKDGIGLADLVRDYLMV